MLLPSYFPSSTLEKISKKKIELTKFIIAFLSSSIKLISKFSHKN